MASIEAYRKESCLEVHVAVWLVDCLDYGKVFERVATMADNWGKRMVEMSDSLTVQTLPLLLVAKLAEWTETLTEVNLELPRVFLMAALLE